MATIPATNTLAPWYLERRGVGIFLAWCEVNLGKHCFLDMYFYVINAGKVDKTYQNFLPDPNSWRLMSVDIFNTSNKCKCGSPKLAGALCALSHQFCGPCLDSYHLWPSDSGKDPSRFLTPIEEAMPWHVMSHASSPIDQSKPASAKHHTTIDIKSGV